MKQLYMILLVSTLAACGGGSSGSSDGSGGSGGSGGDTSDSVQGLTTPSNISVVTAD